ncbi:hypothetical protein [Bdellovibrio bacteriovorus]|uniref:hypothetical protein n=1 Tax=Bdellovibrio TaxID=958 RepID=UPI0035A95E6E
MYRLINIILLIMITCVSLSTYAEDVNVCKALRAAVGKVSINKKWNAKGVEEVFIAFQRNKACDDGGYSEAVTDIVVKSLAKDFVNVVTMINSKKDLSLFVKRHVNATANYDDVDKIIENASKICPTQYKETCRELKNVAEEASAEAKSVLNN